MVTVSLKYAFQTFGHMMKGILVPICAAAYKTAQASSVVRSCVMKAGMTGRVPDAEARPNGAGHPVRAAPIAQPSDHRSSPARYDVSRAMEC